MKSRRDKNQGSTRGAGAPPRLQLRRETLRVLSEEQLGQVQGGVVLNGCTMPGSATHQPTSVP